MFLTGCLLRDVQGPFYLLLYDPSYAYLINALNLSQLSGYGVGHFDHPGTPVQMIGAVTVKLVHILSSSDSEISKDVLSRPEVYLYWINKSLVIINCTGLFLLGIFTFRISGNLFLSLLLQLSPFTSTELFYGLIIVTPENLLLFDCMCFIVLLVYYYFKSDTEHSNKLSVRLIILFGVICGLGLSTKINFLPLLVIPLIIITGIRSKVLFSAVTLISFTIFVSPALSNYEYFLEWLEKLIISSGKYGKGESTVINTSTFFQNLLLIFRKDYLFGISYVLLLISLALNISINEKKVSDDRKTIKLSYAIFFAFTFQLFLVAKHYSQYYMIPSFMLIVFSLVMSLFLNQRTFPEIEKLFNLQRAYAFLIIVIFSWSIYQIIISYNEGYDMRKDEESMVELIDTKYHDALVIPSFGTSSKEGALAFASQYAAGQSSRYRGILSENSNSKIFFNQWGNVFYYISDRGEIKSIFNQNRKVLVQISLYGSVDEFLKALKKESGIEDIKAELIYTNKGNESLYEIKQIKSP